MAQTIQVVIGISVRPDSGGSANRSDMAKVGACRQMFSKPMRFGGAGAIAKTWDEVRGRDDYIEVVVVVKAVPDLGGAQPRNAQAVQTARTAAPVAANFSNDLNGVDMVYIPGAPVAPPSQADNAHGMQASTPFKQTEAVSRDAFERKLIDAAMSRGIPVMAVCAGSWRLLESFGGRVDELSADQIATHHGGGWNTNHELQVDTSKRGMVNRAALVAAWRRKVEQQHEALSARFSGSNSTHWAAAGTVSTAGAAPVMKLAKLGGGSALASDADDVAADADPRQFRDPGALLDIIATEPVTGTVEAYESCHGAPMVGTQWHPESFNPGQIGQTESYANAYTIGFSQEIFKNMIMAAVASKMRRGGVVQQLNSTLNAIKQRKRLAQVAAEGADAPGVTSEDVVAEFQLKHRDAPETRGLPGMERDSEGKFQFA